MVKILVASNHGDTLEPKEGADARKHNLVMELTKHNDVVILESSRYKRRCIQVPPKVKIYYFTDYFLGSKPLSPFTDFNPSFVLKMRKIVKNEGIDLIQISFPMGITTTKLIITLMRKKIPVVYDTHNVEGDYARQVSSPDLPCLLSIVLSFYISLLERFAVKCVNHIIAVSDKDASRFVEKYKLPKSKITVIPSGGCPTNQL